MAGDLCREGTHAVYPPRTSTLPSVESLPTPSSTTTDDTPLCTSMKPLCGGGSSNLNITGYMKEQLVGTGITVIVEIGVPAGAKEAISFAQLGMECFVG
jgi:hypothetical protein